jgi:GNAT superfamily N-acetyltransferase
MTIRIEPLSPRHHSGIIAVAQSLPEWFDTDSRTWAIPIDLRFQEGFVAIIYARVVGFILLFVSEGRVNISWMGVHPDYHRQGIGGLLLDAAESFGRAIGVCELTTYTLGDSVEYEPYEATRAFYRDHGFEIFQRSQTDNPGCPEEIKLKKNIC